MNINLYFLHRIISKLGNKITSFSIVFMLMSNFPEKALFITIFIFSISSITDIFLSKLYLFITKNIKNIKMLVILDILAAISVIAIFCNFNNIVVLILLYIVHSIINDLIERLDSGLFYKLTKNFSKESKQYQMSASIDTVLSLIAPVLTTVLIECFGNKNSLLLDSFSFFFGSIIYYLIIQHLNLKQYYEDSADNIIEKDTNKSLFFIFKKYCGSISFDFRKLLLVYIIVALVTNLEEPLIFNYLSIERGFSKELVGVSFTLFSLGMLLGSRLYSVIENKNISILSIVSIDAICSFLLSFHINRYFIIALYTMQGAMAIIIMITFKVSMQKEFETYEKFSEFRNVFIFIMSFVNLFSYLFGIILSVFLLKGSLIFKIMATIEVFFTAIVLNFLKINKERREKS